MKSVVSNRKLTLAYIAGFIFPGTGHLYLGFVRRGLIILLISLVAVISTDILIFGVTSRVVFKIYPLLPSLTVGVWQIIDLKRMIRKKLDKHQPIKSPAEFKTLVITIIIISLFEIALVAVFQIEFGDDFLGTPTATGSMVPTIHRDDLEITKSKEAGASFDNLRRGDIIVFYAPYVSNSMKIMHRVTEIRLDSYGSRIIITKGDANPKSLPGIDSPIREQDYIGKLVYIIPSTFALMFRLLFLPHYLMTITSAVITIVYFYRKRTQEEKEGKLGVGIRYQQKLVTSRIQFLHTAILIALVSTYSFTIINPYIPKSYGHNVGALATPAIATSNNNVYISWNDISNGKYNIFLTKSTDGGNSFSKIINVSHSLGRSGRPAIAVSSTNKDALYISWASNSTGNYEIYFAKSTDGGKSFSKPVNLSHNLGFSARPTIALSEDKNNSSKSNNNLYVAWHDNSTGNYEIYFAKSTDGGNSFSKCIRISSTTKGASLYPTMFAFKTNLYLSWISNSTRDHGTYFTKSINGGNSFSEPVKVSNLTFATKNPIPSYDMTASENTVYVPSTSNSSQLLNDVYVTKSTDGGNSFSRAARLDNITGINFELRILASGSNRLYVAWTQDNIQSGTIDVELAKSNVSGNGISEPINISKELEGVSFHQNIAASADNVYVVWNNGSDANYAIYFCRSTDDGNSFSEPTNLSSNTESLSR